MKKHVRLLVIRRSCVTGRAVWLYQGAAKASSNVLYSMACKREMYRVDNLEKTAERRKSNILRLLNDCLTAIPITSELSDVQKSAVKSLQTASTDFHPDLDFYEHIMAVRQRRDEDRKIRQQMRDAKFI